MSSGGTPYQARYGSHTSMPMPNVSNQSSFNTPYPATSIYTTQNTTYQTSALSTSSEIDAAVKELTEVISSAQNEELETLLNNDDRLNELVNDSQITKNLKQKCEEMENFNKDQAVTNLSLEPEIKILKEKLSELSQQQNELRDRYLNLQTKLGGVSSVDTIVAILQAAAAEKETISDNIKTNFYDGDVSIDEFMKQFVEERKLYQLRKIKSEKMKVILQNHPHGRQGGTSGPGYQKNQQVGYQMNRQPQYPPRPPPPAGYYGSYNAR